MMQDHGQKRTAVTLEGDLIARKDKEKSGSIRSDMQRLEARQEEKRAAVNVFSDEMIKALEENLAKEKQIDGPLSRQLKMARFAYHKQIVHKYMLKMQHWGATEEDAREEYRKSMENYDQILGLAVSEPERIDACEEDMARGFEIP